MSRIFEELRKSIEWEFPTFNEREWEFPGCADFFAKYTVTGEVQVSGAGARWYRALDSSSGEARTLKLVEKQGLPEEEVMHEAGLYRELAGTPGVITLLDVFETDTHIYLVLKEALGPRLAQERPASEQAVRLIMRQVLQALVAIHDRGLVYNDLSAHTVLVCGETVKLTDLGHAERMPECGNLHTFCGDPLYMAPEVVEVVLGGSRRAGECRYEPGGRGYGPERDMWAAGVLMYWMLTDHHPFPHLLSQLDAPWLARRGAHHYVQRRLDQLWGADLWERNEAVMPSAVSTHARHLLSRLLEKTPTERLSAKEALNHEFFLGGELKKSPMSIASALEARSEQAEAVSWSGRPRLL